MDKVHLLRGAFHAAAASYMAWGLTRLETLPINAYIIGQYGGHFQFLTIQGLAIAFMTMCLSVAVDLLPGVHWLVTAKRGLFMLALPVAIVVSSVYWPLILLFPDLIARMAPELEGHAPISGLIPLPIDLALHASPTLSLILDFYVLERKYNERELLWAPWIAALAVGSYGTFCELCGKKNGMIFPYPFLTDSPFVGRVAIYVGAGFLALWSFRGINKAHP